jgi:hypothetical protein
MLYIVDCGLRIYYCINGIERGYVNNSPFEAFTLAMIKHIILSIPSKMTIGIPTIMKHKGIARTIYRSIDNSKLSEFLPFMFTQADSSFLDNQQISGPIIPPNGKKNPAKADKWHNIAQFLSVSDNILFSSMTNSIY